MDSKSCAHSKSSRPAKPRYPMTALAPLFSRRSEVASIIQDPSCFLPTQNIPPQRETYTGKLGLKQQADLVSLPTVRRCLTYQYGGGVMGIGIGGIGNDASGMLDLHLVASHLRPTCNSTPSLSTRRRRYGHRHRRNRKRSFWHESLHSVTKLLRHLRQLLCLPTEIADNAPIYGR